MTFGDLKRRFWPGASAESVRLVILLLALFLLSFVSRGAERADAPEQFLGQTDGAAELDAQEAATPLQQADVVDNDGPASAETGIASWYGPGFHRRKTASGEPFDMFAMTAAHRTLAFGTLICVRSQITGRGVVVRVNDRGPRVPGRVVDLSRAAAMELGVHGLGLKPVEVVPLPPGRSTCQDD
ncbi:MAG: septal ring lytic transglycosylase RlpA family protein [Gammaproteobacteria bacterium]|nr:septal ring lytic transglycosylase RlpA family protein [Gammaproteobacteria bacterium]MBU1505056.1 septal ring lytic transglycosylase RlpA family protein [Gammaproteobacteria bacterium]MBU2122255.1 septal ring lytic transglycosylase RlpA family protein [Gammaproteobacteria bacterium]MBU2169863.1 septal ring lytic transglycosylase RlpA family protein [Gammaproteobacteria bacterium]MBU2198644.1 septal ring lytic transglycosylase RlpA family protein [Gammaproteobacteria bacterium]